MIKDNIKQQACNCCISLTFLKVCCVTANKTSLAVFYIKKVVINRNSELLDGDFIHFINGLLDSSLLDNLFNTEQGNRCTHQATD